MTGWFTESFRGSAMEQDEDFYREMKDAEADRVWPTEDELAELRRIDEERETEAERDTVARTHCGRCSARPGETCRDGSGLLVPSHSIRRDARLRLVLA